MPLVFSVNEFCKAHRISRASFYKLLKAGNGPAIMKVGKGTLVSAEAAAEWRKRMQGEAGDALSVWQGRMAPVGKAGAEKRAARRAAAGPAGPQPGTARPVDD